MLSKTIIRETCIELITTFPKNIITFTHDGLKVKIIIDGKNGKKTIPINNFFIGYRKTKLKQGDFIYSVKIPILK